MARNGFDIRELKKFRDNLVELEENIDIVLEDCAKELAARLIREVKKRTPTNTGNLRRNWQVTGITKDGFTYTIMVINQTEYAIYVEYGHRQQPGRYVPAINRRLKKGWVPGQFMMTISAEDIQRKAPQIVEKIIARKLGEYFK
jgi:hypothetical protein